MVPVSESLDSGKRMIAGTEDSARPDLLEIDRFIRDLVISEIVRHFYVRYVYAFRIFLIQPF